MKRRDIVFAAAGAALLSVAGCASNAPPIRWYEVRGEPPGPLPSPSSNNGAVWELAGAVRLPGALDRDMLQVASGQAGLQPLPGHRWAEPLRDSIPRLLLQDLRRLRGDSRVWPAPAGVTVAARLALEVSALQAAADGRTLQLRASWSLQDTGGRVAPMFGNADIAVPLADSSVDTLAAAHRLALWQLAQRIAATDRV